MKHIATRGVAVLGCFLAVSIAGAQAPTPPTVETGTLDGATYRIAIPANWNRGLVMFAHGYTQPTPAAETEGVQRSRDIFLSRGFALAESAYRYESSVEAPGGFRQGWAIKEGLRDTEVLRKHFVTRHGKPAKTFIVGESMGAVIAIATIERYQEEYNGALPMCGPLISASEFLDYGILDLLVTFDYFFPNVLSSPFKADPTVVDRVRAALKAEPEKAAAFAERVNRPRVGPLAGNVALYQTIAAELTQRAGGNPFDNISRVYTGFGDDAALNRSVKRYTADPVAREYIRQYYTPTGRIADPVLTVVLTGDQMVLPDWATKYELLTVRERTEDRFVAQFVEGQGHCTFTLAQRANAFDALVTWEREGKPPASGRQK